MKNYKNGDAVEDLAVGTVFKYGNLHAKVIKATEHERIVCKRCLLRSEEAGCMLSHCDTTNRTDKQSVMFVDAYKTIFDNCKILDDSTFSLHPKIFTQQKFIVVPQVIAVNTIFRYNSDRVLSYHDKMLHNTKTHTIEVRYNSLQIIVTVNRSTKHATLQFDDAAALTNFLNDTFERDIVKQLDTNY